MNASREKHGDLGALSNKTTNRKGIFKMNVSDKNQNEEEPNSKAADQLIDSLLKNAAANPEGGDDEAFLSQMEGLLDAEPGKEKPGSKQRAFLVVAGGIAAAVALGFTTWFIVEAGKEQLVVEQPSEETGAAPTTAKDPGLVASTVEETPAPQPLPGIPIDRSENVSEKKEANEFHVKVPRSAAAEAAATPPSDAEADIPPGTQRYIAQQQELVKKADEAALRGSQMMADEDYEGAVEQYIVALNTLPDVKITEARRAAYTRQYANASVRVAEQRAEEAEYALATQLVQNVLQPNIDPDNREAKRLLERLQDPEYYSPALTPAHLEKVRRVEFALKVAQAHLDLGDYDGAERRYNEALTHDPYNFSARRGLEATEQEQLEYFEVARNKTRSTFMRKIVEGWVMPVPAGSSPSTDATKNEKAGSDGGSGTVAGADGSETSTGINITGTMGTGGNVSAASVNSPPGANQSHLLATTGSDETQSAPGKVQVGYPPTTSGLRAGSNSPGVITAPAPVTPVFENLAKRGNQTRGMNDFERDNFRGATRRTVNPAGNQPMDATPEPDQFGRRILPPEEGHPAAARTVTRVSQLIDNPWMSPLGEPLSTFSIDVDTASWTNIRGMLERGMSMNQIPQDSVRIEEMINYFDWKYPQPDNEHPFAFAVESAACPWNADSQLLRVAIQGKDIQRTKRPASNLVFLLDVSGSMNQPNKLPLVKKAISVLVEELNENDCVSVVVYAGAEGVALYPTKGNEQAEILSALDHLKAGGSTNGGAGINLAYKIAAQNFIKDGTNRVILCTDGDFNVGLTGTETLTQLVERKAKKDRVFLSVCGFGNDNLNDAMLESITNKGNGTYYFIDTFAEARKVFLKDMMATLVTIAKDVKIQVEFNPGQVKAYRLIGYANRRLAAKDFEDDRVDAGEIGAGHSVTAFYEIVPADSKSNPLQEMTSNLRYQKEVAPEPLPQAKMEIVKSPELALLKLRYKAPDGDVSKLVEQTVMPNGRDWRNASRDYRFASAVALFGMKLRGHDSVRSVEIPEIIAMAEASMGNDPHGYRAEFVRLLKKAAQ